MAWYKTGLATFTNGSPTVVGSGGTSWVLGAAVGEAIMAPDGKIYEITNIASDTFITISPAYGSSASSGVAASYTIAPTQSFMRDLAAQASILVNNYASVANLAGSGKFSDGSVSLPGIRFIADEDTGVRRSSTNQLSLVTGGVDRLTVNGSGAFIAGELRGDRATNVGPLGSNANNSRNHFTQYNAGTAPPSGGWIAAAFGDTTGNRVAIGQFSGVAVIAGHNGDLSNWAKTSYRSTEHEFCTGSNAGDMAMAISTTGAIGLKVTPSAWHGNFSSIDGHSTGGFWTNTSAGMGFANNAYVASSDGQWKYKTNHHAQVFEATLSDQTFRWSAAGVGTSGQNVPFNRLMTLDNSGRLSVAGPVTGSWLGTPTTVMGGSGSTNGEGARCWKIATLPASTDGTYDHVDIMGTWGAWTIGTKGSFRVRVSARAGVELDFIEGSDRGASIEAWQLANGSVEVWIHLRGAFQSASWSVLGSILTTLHAPEMQGLSARQGTKVATTEGIIGTIVPLKGTVGIQTHSLLIDRTTGGSVKGQRGGTPTWYIGDQLDATGSGNGMAAWVYGDSPFRVYTNGTERFHVNSQSANFYPPELHTSQFSSFRIASDGNYSPISKAGDRMVVAEGGPLCPLLINSQDASAIRLSASGVQVSTRYNTTAVKLDDNGNTYLGARVLGIAADRTSNYGAGSTMALNLEQLSGINTSGLLIIRGNENGLNQTLATYSYNLSYNGGTRYVRIRQIDRNTVSNNYGDVYAHLGNYFGNRYESDQAAAGDSTTSNIYLVSGSGAAYTANFSLIRIN